MIEIFAIAAVLCIPVYLFVRLHRDRTRNAPLRGEIEARVCFDTRLSHVRILGTGGFRGTRGQWISLRGQTRLIVGTDAFMIEASQALREYVFTGRDSSIAFSEAPSRIGDQGWIIITGQAGGLPVRIAISHHNLPEVWRALARTGVAQTDEPTIGW
jgi:hypothetical protein